MESKFSELDHDSESEQPGKEYSLKFDNNFSKHKTHLHKSNIK